MRNGIFIGLLLLAAVVFWHRDTALLLSGLQPLKPPTPAGLDHPPELGESSAKAFFDQRNVLDVEVPRDMTAGELLRLYVIDQPHIRRQIADQEGLPALGDATPLAKGRVYRIVLTPLDVANP